MRTFEEPKDDVVLRDALTAIPGVGLKTASWAVRNHRASDSVAVLDVHIVRACEHLGISTEIRVSSSIPIDHGLKNQEKVLALCEAVGSRGYVNAIGGMELYAKDEFRARGIDLKFVKSRPLQYPQFDHPFGVDEVC